MSQPQQPEEPNRGPGFSMGEPAASGPSPEPQPTPQPSYDQPPYAPPAAPQHPYGEQQAYGTQQGYGYGGQPSYGNQSYGQQPYGVAQPSYGNDYYPAEHPQTSAVFVLGIVGIFVGVCSFIAWYLGAQARKEIEAGAPYPWAGKLKTGYLLGKVFSILYLVGIGFTVAMMILFTILGIASY